MSNLQFTPTSEVAARLNITPRQVVRLVPARLKPVFKAPGPRGALFFDRAEVEALAQEREK